jgi:hypothetical protein
MSALANSLQPSEPFKKSAGRATRSGKLNKYGRDPQSFSESQRGRPGYSPFYHSMRADIYRLSSGAACMALMLEILANSEGRGTGKGKPRDEWTLALSVADLAQICCCDERTIERELKALQERGIAEIERPEKGKVKARLKREDWQALPDHPRTSKVVQMAANEDATPEVSDEQEAKPGNQRVTGKKPVRLPAGSLSRVFPVSCGVKAFRYKADGPVDLDITAVIQAGELIVTSRLPDTWVQRWKLLEAESERKAKAVNCTPSNGSNGLEEKPRHARRGSKANVGRKSAGVDHPRAAELCEVFDPILSEQAVGLLVMDPVSLQKACEAVGDMDPAYLKKFAGNRGNVKIKTAKHVPLICADAYQAWKASKVLNSAGAVTKEQIDELIAQERAELAKKRAESRRK